MSSPIRAELPTNQPPAPADKGTLLPISSCGGKDFKDLLDSHIESDEPPAPDAPKEEKPKKPADESQVIPWTILGIVPGLIQILPTPLPSVSGSDLPREGCSPPDQNATVTASETPDPAATINKKEEGDSLPPGNLLEILKQKIPLETVATRPTEAQIAEPQGEKAEKSSGIPAAQQPSMLLTSAKTDEPNSATEQQKNSVSLDKFEAPAFEQELKRLDPEEPHARREEIRVDRPQFGALDLISGESKAHSSAPMHETVALRPVDPTAIIDAVRNHVQILRTSNQDRLEVVLRPDGNTQILLQVLKVDGQIQVQARCERGDFALLQANWNSIQQNLSSQGIRVEPIERSVNTGANWTSNSGGQQSSEQSAREDRPREWTNNDLAPRKPVRPVRANGTRERGWNSWA